jgi:hypothetical protein
MAKEKKQLTVKQKQKRYRTYQYLTFGGEFVSVLTPFIVMGAINYQEWFKVEEGWKVGLGGALALALMGIATFLFAKKKENKEITDGFITFIIGWFAVAFILKLLGSILDQIFEIMMFGGIGILGALGLDIWSKDYKKKADTYKEVLGEVKADTLKEQAKKELEKENGIAVD